MPSMWFLWEKNTGHFSTLELTIVLTAYTLGRTLGYQVALGTTLVTPVLHYDVFVSRSLCVSRSVSSCVSFGSRLLVQQLPVEALLNVK